MPSAPAGINELVSLSFNSSKLYIEPVGLPGLFNISHLVFEVIFFSNCLGEILNWLFSVHSTITGFPSAKSTISG